MARHRRRCATTVRYWPCLAPTLGGAKTRRYQIRNTRMLSSSTCWIWMPSAPQPWTSVHAMAPLQAESMNKLYSSMVFVSSHLIKLVHGLLDTYPGNLVLPIILGGHGLLLQFLGNGGVGWKARKQKGGTWM